MMNVPDWFSQGALYQINPRTFSEAGTIAAVTKELSFIASLGFSVVYLCPIFEEDDSIASGAKMFELLRKLDIKEDNGDENG